MAVTVDISTTMTTLWTGDVVGTWTGGSPATYTGFQREGGACLGIQVSTATVDVYAPVTSFNFNINRIYIWVLPRGEMDTMANGGVRIIVGDGTNRVSYYVGGGNYMTPFFVAGWYCVVLDRNNLPTGKAVLAGSEANMNWAAITQVGVGFKTLSKSLGGAPNCFWDIGRRGTGAIIGGGTSVSPGKWSEIAADDASLASGKAYGLIMEFQPGVYGLQGQFTFGNGGSSNSHFEDIDSTAVFMDTGVSDNFYKLDVLGGTGTNIFIQGIKTGTGDSIGGRNGVTILSGGPTVDVNLHHNSMNSVHWYGGKLSNIRGSISLPQSVSSEIAGVAFDQSFRVAANQCIIRNCTFSNTFSNSSLLWNNTINIRNCTFSANSDLVLNKHAIEHSSSGTYSYNNLRFGGNDYDIEFSGTGSLVINAINGANPATYNITGSGTGVTINNTKSFSFTVNPSIINYEWRIYEVTAAGSLAGAVELAGTEYAGSDNKTYAYSYSGDKTIAVQIISQPNHNYVESITYYTLGDNDQNVTINLIIDTNN